MFEVLELTFTSDLLGKISQLCTWSIKPTSIASHQTIRDTGRLLTIAHLRPLQPTSRKMRAAFMSTLLVTHADLQLAATALSHCKSLWSALERVSTDTSFRSFPGKQVLLEWDNQGATVGPNNSYITATNAGAPKYVAWAQQLNLTYTDLVITGPNSGYTFVPPTEVYQGGQRVVNDTVFLALVDSNPFLTPFNLSMLNPHVVALGLFTAG